jgi:pyridoxal phosphate enzyme (YggS family)
MSEIIESVSERLQAVQARIADAARVAGRTPDSIRLIAVSKTFPAGDIAALLAAGQREFGESYLQEAETKIETIGDAGVTWHFIGPIQSNKTRAIAEHFHWVHSIERTKIAERLAAQRPARLPRLDVCLQVNVSGEATKSGVSPDDVPPLARAIAGLDRLRLRGLMAIPEPTDDIALQRARFRMLRELRDRIALDVGPLDTLSMGMSDDLESAIAEGSTMVRVGRALFGARPRAV